MSRDRENDLTDKLRPEDVTSDSDATHFDRALKSARDDDDSTIMKPSPPPTEDRPPVEKIGDFRIVRELGRGGMGIVFEAIQESLGRRVALKILPQHASLDPTSLGRFRREAEAAGRLDHPGLCAVYGTGTANGLPYIVMRYIEGEPLARLILKTKARPDRASSSHVVHLPLHAKDSGDDDSGSRTETLAGPRGDIMRVCLLIERAARAVHHAHESGVIHRDLKPPNIIVTPDGKPVILDFGLAGDATGENAGLTQTGDVFGTPAYMAPEQCRGDVRALDRKVDVYALGVTLYECLTLKKPFDAPTREALVQLILTKEPTDARVFNPEIDEDLAVVIETALEKNAARRYISALDFAEDLRRVRMFEPIRAKKIRWPTKAIRWAQRNRATAALLVSLAVGIPTVAALAGVLYVKYPEAERERLRVRLEERDRFVESGFDLVAASRNERDHRLERAEQAFASALAIEAESPEAVIGKMLVARRRAHHEEVVRLVDDHPKLKDGVRGALILKIDALEALDRRDAAEVVRKSIPAAKSALDFALEATVELERNMNGPPEGCRDALRDAHRAVVMSRFARPLYYYLWARAAGYAGDREQAAAAAEAVTALWPESPRANFYAAYAYHLSGDPERALAGYRRAIVIDPGHIDAHYNLAHAFQILGRLEESEAEYRETLAIEPEDYAAQNNIGTVLMDLGKFDEAAAIYERGLERAPEDTSLLSNYAQVELLRSRADHARALLDRAVAADEKIPVVGSRDPAVYAAYGALYVKETDYAEAARWYAKAREVAPNEMNYAACHGYALARSGDRAQGLAVIEKIVDRPGLALSSRLMCAQVLSDAGRHDEALRRFEAIVRAHPQNAPALNNYGNALESAGKHPEALDVYRRALVVAPDSPLVHSNILDCCEVLAEPLEFVTEMKRWEALGAPDVVGWARLVDLLLRLKREEPDLFDAKAAALAADRLTEIAGKDTDALFAAARARRAAGALDAAIRDAEQALAVFPPDEEDGTPGANTSREEIERFLVACRAEKK